MVQLLDRLIPPPAANIDGVIARVQTLLKFHAAEMAAAPTHPTAFSRQGLDTIHEYLLGLQPHPSIPGAATTEIRRLAMMSRVNVLDIIVGSVAQSMYVDGYRTAVASGAQTDDQNAPAWDIWQGNNMDARQSGIHRAALAYGVSYVTVLPGTPVPVIRGHSPRSMVAMYGFDDEWPRMALQMEPVGNKWSLRLFDETRVYDLGAPTLDGSDIEFLVSSEHGATVTPVVRYLNVNDLDEDHLGEIERLIPVQDQIDETTFGLLVAQKFSAFRQRYVIGWTTEAENDKVKAAASRLWTFDDDKNQIQVGEFEQTDLKGFLDSREASLRHAATLSQTPAHELIGQMINLSAEALVAAEASQRRKVVERQMSFGEAHEQMLALAASLGGVAIDPQAQVRWRDTESRAFAAVVDGLVKLQTLGVPVQLLIERIPGFTQQDVQRAISIIESGDPLAALTRVLSNQNTPPADNNAPPFGNGAAA